MTWIFPWHQWRFDWIMFHRITSRVCTYHVFDQYVNAREQDVVTINSLRANNTEVIFM